MKKVLSLMIIYILLLTGCSTPSVSDKPVAEKATVTVETAKGKVTVPVEPKNVVVFDYAVVDFIKTLNVKVDNLATVADRAPSYLKDFVKDSPAIGGLFEPDFEKIASLKPDVIFIASRTEKAYDQLKEIAPVVYLKLDNKDYYTSFKNNSLLLGQIFNNLEAVQNQLLTIDKKVTQIQELASASKEKALVTLINEGKINNFGPISRFGFIYNDLKLEPVDPNVEDSRHGVEISYEYISEKNPDIFYYVNRGSVVGGNKDVSEVLNNPLIKETNAAKNQKIIELDANYVYLSAGGLTSFDHTITEVLSAFKKTE